MPPSRTIFQRPLRSLAPPLRPNRRSPYRPRTALNTFSTTAQINIEAAPESAIATTALINIEAAPEVAFSTTALINLEAVSQADAGAINEVINLVETTSPTGITSRQPIRIRAELFDWSVTLRQGVTSEFVPFFTGTQAQQLTDEFIGPKVGTGPLYGLGDFEYTLELNKIGRWSVRAPVSDVNLEPIFDGSAKVAKFYLEGVGHIYTGWISDYEITQEEEVVLSGYGMGILLSRHSALYRFFFGYGQVDYTAAYMMVLSFLMPATYSIDFIEGIGTRILPVEGKRFQDQTIEECMNDLNSYYNTNWRVHPSQMVIEIGGMGDDSGLLAAPIIEDDPLAREQGVLAITNLVYSHSDDELVNMIVGQGSNNSFGMAVELRHTEFQRKYGQISFYPFADVSFPEAGATDEILAEDLDEESVLADLRLTSKPDTDIDIVAVAQKITIDHEYDLAFAAFFFYRVSGIGLLPRLDICTESGGEPNTASPVFSTTHANVFQMDEFPKVREDDEKKHFCELIFFPESALGYWRLPAGTYWFVVSLRTTTVAGQPAFFPTGVNAAAGSYMVFGATDDNTYLTTDPEGVTGTPASPHTSGLGVLHDGGAWEIGGDYENWWLLMELSGRFNTAADIAKFPFIVEGQFAAAIDRTEATTGLRVFYIRDNDSILEHGLREAMVTFPYALDSREGVIDVEPACNNLYLSSITFMDRHKQPFEKLSFDCAGSFRLPKVGQKIRVVYRGIADTENGKRKWIDIDGLFWVLSINTRFSEEGISHSFVVTNQPEDLLDPERITNELIRQANRTSAYLSEFEYGMHVGIVREPE